MTKEQIISKIEDIESSISCTRDNIQSNEITLRREEAELQYYIQLLKEEHNITMY